MLSERPTFAQFEQRELLRELATDVATTASIIKDTGRDLTRQQREALRRLVVAARVVRDTIVTREAGA